MVDDLTSYEKRVLCGEVGQWGAAVSAAFEVLKARGLLDCMGNLTKKGRYVRRMILVEKGHADDYSHAAKVICDSVSPAGHRLTTMIVTMPRLVLPQFLTHRAFSRNGASTRAIPAKKMIARVRESPYCPEVWGKNQPGMQLSEEEVDSLELGALLWRSALTESLHRAEDLDRLGCHKQIVNDLLTPFMWQHMIVSATEWSNFFAQRCHGDARAGIAIVAEKMRDALRASTPVLRSVHIPFSETPESPSCIDDGDADTLHGSLLEQTIEEAVARCARLSYLTHDGKRDSTADRRLYDKLINAKPPHASPFEHIAVAGEGKRNFRGWIQERERLKI